jgi:hypothetical protein
MAGEWARVKGTVTGLWPVFLSVFTAGFAAAYAAFVSSSVGIGLFIVSFACVGAGMHFGLARIEKFFIGARGEERVCGILAGLSDRYHVFNDFVAGGVHVDHVVVGPAGVFAIETKNWRGEVTIEEGHILVDGQLPSRPPLKQVLGEAALVKSELAKSGWGGPVTPVLAFASDTFRARVAELNGVVIINSSELRKGFATERVVIPPAELDRLVSLMENNA